MKEFLVIRVYNVMSPVVEASFDDEDKAKQYAELCKFRDGREYRVAKLIQVIGSGVIPLSCLFFACGNIKNTSRLIAEEEEKDVYALMFGYLEQYSNPSIYTFDVVCCYNSSLIYSFLAIIFINEHYSPLIIYNYVKVSFI